MKVDNPLNQFRSYSHHHILLMTNSTRVVEILKQVDFPISNLQKFSGEDGFNVQRKRIVPLANGSFAIEDAPEYDSRDDAFVVISNGSQDSEIFVESVEWENAFAPNFADSQGIDSYSTMALDGNIILREPRGARFFDFLNTAYDMLGTDPASSIFVCKTVFVGYTDNQHEHKADIISNTAPLSFFMYDCTADFDATGSRYEMAFVGLNNGAGKLPQYQYVLDNQIGGIATTTGGTEASGVTLRQAVQTLENRISTRYNDYVQTQRQQRPNFDSEYRTIKYEINLDEVYQSSEYVIDQYKLWNSESTENGGSTLTFQPGSTLESAIHQIMKSCSKVLNDMNQPSDPDSNGLVKRYGYKILSTVDTSAEERQGVETDANQFKIILTVKQYEITSVANGKKALNFTDVDPDDADILEYDYLFTGNNTEVLKFNMSMETSLMFLMEYQNNSPIPSPKEELALKIKGNGKSVNSNNYDYSGVRKQKLLLPPQTLQDPTLSHFRDPLAAGSYRSALNSYAALGALNAVIQIRGNPELMGSILVSPAEMQSGTNRSATVIPNWQTKAGLMKVNVKMPSGDPAAPEVYEPFWYQGAYLMISMRNVFRPGSFTQEINLIPTFEHTTFGIDTVDSVIDSSTDKEQDVFENRAKIDVREITGETLGSFFADSLQTDNYFPIIVHRTLGFEGGYVDNPLDPGGATNFGISMRALTRAMWRDQLGNLIGDTDGDGQITKSDIQNMTQEQAVDIYREFYWKPFRFKDLPHLELAFQVFDMGVNAGPSRAQILLQQAINDLGFNITVDGSIGDETLSAASLIEKTALIEQYKERRRMYYNALVDQNPSNSVFLQGWLNRVNGGDHGHGIV